MEEKNINELLCKEIEEEIKYLKTLEPGGEEHSRAVESLTKLYKIKMDEDTKVDEKQKLNKDVINQYLKLGIDVAGIILPLMFYSRWMNKGFKFEETGTFTSTTFRNLFQKFKTTK
ncbi:MAG: hypothetical protein ACI4XM_01390 [Candidatus Coprovivens sp.]